MIFDIRAIPNAQASNLLGPSFKYFSEISSIKMQRCFSLLIEASNAEKFDFIAARICDDVISWISINSTKPERISQPASIIINSKFE